MPSYRIYLIEEGNARARPTDVDCECNQEALEFARRMIAKPQVSAEVWCERRLLAILRWMEGSPQPTGSPAAFEAEAKC